jgi:hypothetical protein
MPPLPLQLALYVEGNSDRHFLPILIRRTVEAILATRARYAIEVNEVAIINDDMRRKTSHIERILEAARCSEGYYALIVHRDADAPTQARARERYFDPGHKHVQQCSDPVCRTLIPIIPVRMIEAWMLTDPEALCAATETNVNAADLSLPAAPHQVEADKTAKTTLRLAVQKALEHQRRGRRTMSPEDLYPELAARIRLERLRLVPSYSQFDQDMTETLITLGMAQG